MSVAWVGAGIAAVGVVGSAYGDSQASGAAKDASRASAAADKAQLDFEKEKYQEWQDTYGGLEDNLAEYYDGLTPTLRTVQGLESFNKERDLALTGLREQLAQRGIQRSGIAAQVETDVAIGSAEERARIRAAAPMEVAREKLSFLQVGLGQDPSGGISDAFRDQASNANSIANSAAASAGAARKNLIDSGTNLASELVSVFQSKKAASPGEPE